MYKYIVLIFLAAPILATELNALEDESAVDQGLNAESKTGTISLSGSDTSSFLSNAIYVVPVLIFIILLDFAIFGAFATRSDDLNPVSNFFYHARRGLQIIRDRSGRPGRPIRNRHRYQRYFDGQEGVGSINTQHSGQSTEYCIMLIGHFSGQLKCLAQFSMP